MRSWPGDWLSGLAGRGASERTSPVMEMAALAESGGAGGICSIELG